jgi:hypothetical protein
VVCVIHICSKLSNVIDVPCDRWPPEASVAQALFYVPYLAMASAGTFFGFLIVSGGNLNCVHPTLSYRVAARG